MLYVNANKHYFHFTDKPTNFKDLPIFTRLENDTLNLNLPLLCLESTYSVSSLTLILNFLFPQKDSSINNLYSFSFLWCYCIQEIIKLLC